MWKSRLRNDPELQSAVVRIGTSVLGSVYIGLGAWTSYYRIDLAYFIAVFATHFVLGLVLLASVWHRPQWPARRYFALCLDVIVTSLAIAITQDAISPFYLLYILIFISAGTRFGRGHLILAAVVAVVAYNFVLIGLDEWRRHTFEATFFLALLILLPWYQASLLRQLQQARLDAERANRAKGDFLAVMTHELRTPLTGVIGLTQLLEGTRLDATQRDHVRGIAHSADMLNALIGDILDFSKIEARKLALERVSFDPSTLVRELCEILTAKALDKGLELVCRIEPEVPRPLLGDPLRVRQILFNLLGNAIKFTERGEVGVRLAVAPSGGGLERPHLLLEVTDTGIGIPKDKLEVLFESFRQADDSTTRRVGGTGLGTTIARELVLLMGGLIEVESEPGRGSCFRVRLPLLDDAPGQVPDQGRKPLAGRVVLVDEPNAAQRAWIMETLARGGADCRGLDDQADGPGPDLVVLALASSGADACAVVEPLRTRFGWPVPALVLGYVGHRPSRLPEGVAFLSKPFLPAELVEAAARLGEGVSEPHSPGYPVPLDQVLAPLESAALADGGLRVLVAEDNEIAAKVISGFLARLGVAYTRFRDGASALAAALDGGYAMAIIDLHMPELDGFGFARRFRAARPAQRFPIIALTANASEDQRRDCIDAGMDAFLTKPIQPEALRSTLVTWSADSAGPESPETARPASVSRGGRERPWC